MNREGKKCVLYPRVSTEMQVDGYSLEGQKNGLKRFADREEMEIVGIYEDAGKSGKSIEGRPAFKKMLSDIKNGLEIDYILVYKLSRFGRNAADILNSLEFVQSYGINLICIEEGIDSSQTSGKLLISVLSAVAEIERENIIEQTMNGRREKARQGGWNGGFAPYGYYLKDNQLLIEETEAEAIRIIFDKFANSDIGLGGVAKYLNLQGIKKIPRQNGTLETWSSHFIRLILDNPVYCGKIAYGRRTREKVKGTKNEYKQVHSEDYILEDGQHEGIISEELWQKVHAKRMATGIKQPSKIGKDRSHLLTGILKCPLCGSSMYTNKHAWTNKDGTYKEVYYYICGRNKQERGHHCDYKASLRKTDIEPLVIEAVKELVSDKYFAKEIEKRIGVQTDTTAIDKELANYESKLKEVDLNKARLEREIDNLPIDARFRERKIHDMTLRLDALYDTIVELEERIEDAKLRKSSIEMETITLDNIYKLMLNFGKLYDIISDEEKKSLITYLIKEIQIYPNGESEQPLKSIEFNFPIYRDGQEVRRLLWEKGNTVEMKEALTTLHDWYEKGLINPEVGTTTNGDNANNVKNGTCGIFMGPWWSLGYGNPDSFRNDNNANWQAYPLYTKDGEWNIHMKDVGTTYTMVNKNASDDVKKAIVIMNNVLVRDESTFDTSVAIGWYPLRNTMAATDECEYEYDALMGIIKGEASADDYQQGGSKFNGLYKNLVNDAATLKDVISEDYDGSRDLAVTDMDVNTNNGQFNRFYALLIGDRPYATLEPDHKIYSELYYTIDGMDTYWTQISDLEDKSILQFITGAKSLDEWDQFCTDWHVQGGDQILELVKDYLAE